MFLSLGILKYKMSYIYLGFFSVLCKLGKREVYTKYYYSQRPCIFKVIQEPRITNAKETSNLETNLYIACAIFERSALHICAFIMYKQVLLGVFFLHCKTYEKVILLKN